MLNWALILIWPLMQVTIDPIVLSSQWDDAGTFDTGLDRLAAVVVCPAPKSLGGALIAVDSSGEVAEMAFHDGQWLTERSFSIGADITAVCPAATRGKDQDWELILGTGSGRVIALTRTMVGWSSQDVATLRDPIIDIQATEAMPSARSSVFVIDGDGEITEFVIGSDASWLSGPLPPIPGGATKVCFHPSRLGLRVSAAGAGGIIYRIGVDSAGIWRPEPWANLGVPPLDMAPSTDPTMRDIALFFSGTDGLFRYLFHQRTGDDIARLPVGNGTEFLLGAGDRRRINEFFAMSDNDFCLFEFDPGLEDWVRMPIAPIKQPVVSVSFGPARGERGWQFCVASLDGTVHEFTRAKTPDPDDDE